jgi:hypothetical protein
MGEAIQKSISTPRRERQGERHTSTRNIRKGTPENFEGMETIGKEHGTGPDPRSKPHRILRMPGDAYISS